MRTSVERCVEMQLYIATGKPKKDFGELTENESDSYDRIKANFEYAQAKGLVLEVANEGVTPIRRK
jgi:hypothetical protein